MVENKYTGELIPVSFAYDYEYGYSDRYVIFWAPFQRFHYCKAATLDKPDAHYFVSYATPVALLLRRSSGFLSLYVADEWNCSATTRKQLSRWLRERENGNITYADVREAFKRMRKTSLFKYVDYDRRFEVVSVENIAAHAAEEFGTDIVFSVNRV